MSNWTKFRNRILPASKNNLEKIHEDIQALKSETTLMEHAETLVSKLKIKDPVGLPLKRYGRNNDGGYIMADEMNESHIAYSFGINDDVSWDLDIADKGIQIFQYDPTIIDVHQKHENFHFFPIGIVGNYYNIGISPCTSFNKLKTFEQILFENGHSDNRNLILKMDVDGAEFDFIRSNTKRLNQFSQIVLELHYVNTPEWLPYVLYVLDMLNETHQLIHIHGNNYGPIVNFGAHSFSDAIELTYLRKSDHLFKEATHFYPRHFDKPCNPEKSDYILGFF